MEIIDPPLGKKPASKKKKAARNKSTNLIKNTYVEVQFLSMKILCILFLEKTRRPKSYHPMLSLDNS